MRRRLIPAAFLLPEKRKEENAMVVKITSKQSDKVNRLIRNLCCNYDEGNCLLLDDGEPCCSIQKISRYGIYCNYFLKSVLPADKKLYEEILQHNSVV